MLEDHKRTGAYYNAVIENKRLFKDKVVLDVGTGSGILAIFSAMAGARKVYAVEATDMAKNARKLVAANKVRRTSSSKSSSRQGSQSSSRRSSACVVFCGQLPHLLNTCCRAMLTCTRVPPRPVLCCAALLPFSAGPCGRGDPRHY